MKWWQNIMPIQGAESKDTILTDIHYQRKKTTITLSANGPDPEKTDRVMLVRKRLSRIFFLRNFFDYPISLNFKTLYNLGFLRIFKIFFSYIWVKLVPIKNIVSLEDFFISRFGTELYKTFFKDYTEKVWGIPCNKIPADWGNQRIKELSITKAILHAVKLLFKREGSIEQKDTDTSLIEKFMYPKLGPGQMWEIVAALIKEQGGEIIMNADVVKIDSNKQKITSITYHCNETNKALHLDCDYLFSTMPVKELMVCMGEVVPKPVKKISDRLQYRDFITVGLLLNKLKIKNETNAKTLNNLVPDNWIYIQEKEVKVGRIQIFNNWSPYMVADINKVWIGLEYFCNEGDELWEKNDSEFIKFAIEELHKIDIIDRNEVIDSTILRVPKTYPAYFGSYLQFDEIRKFTDEFENLFLVGRNGMHKYNNQDHSMLTAITAVDNIILGKKQKSNIWEINTEEDYHEKK